MPPDVSDRERFALSNDLKRRMPAVTPHPGQIAQLVEQRTENPRVDGSIPSLATSFFRRKRSISNLLPHRLC